MIVTSNGVPAVLGAVVHLAVLAAHPGELVSAADVVRTTHEINSADTHGADVDPGEMSPPDRWGDPGDAPPAGQEPAPVSPEAGEDRETDRAGELIASGAGRRRLSRELGISEHTAREMLAAHRNGGAS